MTEPTVLGDSELSDDLRAWRTAHPQATFAEIEAAVEEQLDRLRAALLAQAVAAAPQPTAPLRPACPQCGTLLQARGRRERRLTLAGNQQVRLERSYAWCPTCAVGLFPPG
jgi:hypothetical protein